LADAEEVERLVLHIAEARISKHPEPAGRTSLRLSPRGEVALGDVKPYGQLAQMWVSKSVIGAAVLRPLAWLNAAAESERKANFT